MHRDCATSSARRIRQDAASLEPAIEACLELLRLASNLVEAYLRISPYDASALPNTIFSLPRLHSLNLGGTWVLDATMEMIPVTLLKCLKTSALKTLALGFEDPRSRNLTDISSFLSFVSQSSSELHTLTLSCVPVTTRALIECLKSTPSVIHLKLQICSDSNTIDMNSLFAEFTNHPDFLPKLESLGIGLSTRSPTVDPSVVVDMLIWRCLTSIPATTARLQSFLYSVSYDCGLEDSVKSYIQAHPVYPELKALGTELCLNERTFLRPYIDIDV